VEENIAGTKVNDQGMTEDDILELLEGDAWLVCISISDPYAIKKLSISITRNAQKKKEAI
jgi:hypothetical protein